MSINRSIARKIHLLLAGLIIVANWSSPAWAQNTDSPRGGGGQADLDSDGDTDLADLSALLATYGLSTGQPGFLEAADFDDSGLIDLSDLSFLLADYGCLGSALVERLQFAGADFHSVTHDCAAGNCSNYSMPHWLDYNLDGDTDDAGDRAYPVAYTRDSFVSISNLKFGVTPAELELENVPVRGTGPDGLVFEGSGTVSSGELAVSGTLVSSIALPDMVIYFDTFDIEWEVALVGTQYRAAGVTSNRMYVTFDDPMGGRLESFFDISTRAADGAATIEAAIDGIWAEFADLHVENAHGQVMGYYRGVLCASDCTVYEAQPLVVYLNGQCGSWADLLMQCFRTQGISGSQWITIEPLSYGWGLLVRSYNFAGDGASGCSSFPYTFNSPCGGPYWPLRPECTDAEGLPGQDNSNPASYFSRHFIVKINGAYYDPSYGAGPYTGTQDQANLAWEQDSIDGYHSWCGSYHAARKDSYEARETGFQY